MSDKTSSGDSGHGEGKSKKIDAPRVVQSHHERAAHLKSPAERPKLPSTSHERAAHLKSPAERPKLSSPSPEQDFATATNMGQQDTSSGASGQRDAPTGDQQPFIQTADRNWAKRLEHPNLTPNRHDQLKREERREIEKDPILRRIPRQSPLHLIRLSDPSRRHTADPASRTERSILPRASDKQATETNTSAGQPNIFSDAGRQSNTPFASPRISEPSADVASRAERSEQAGTATKQGDHLVAEHGISKGEREERSRVDTPADGVGFRSGSSQLVPGTMEHWRDNQPENIRAALSDPHAQVLITGMASRLGSDSDNLHLSQVRADVVKQWLKDNGVQASIKTLPAGEELAKKAGKPDGNDDASSRIATIKVIPADKASGPNQSRIAGPDDPHIATPHVEYGPARPKHTFEDKAIESEGLGPLPYVMGGVEGAAEGLVGIAQGVFKEYVAEGIIDVIHPEKVNLFEDINRRFREKERSEGRNPTGQPDVNLDTEQDTATTTNMGQQETSSGTRGQGDAPTGGQSSLGQTADVTSPAERANLSSITTGQSTDRTSSTRQVKASSTKSEQVQSDHLLGPTDSDSRGITKVAAAVASGVQESNENRSSIVGATTVLIGADLTTSGLIRETVYSLGKSKIAEEGIKKWAAAGENLSLDTAKAIAADVVEGRNAARALAQEKLPPIGRSYSMLVETPPTLEQLVAKKGGESIDTYKAIVQGADKGREAADMAASRSKILGTGFAVVGGAISAYSLYRDYQKGDVEAGIGDAASVTSSGLTVSGYITAGATGASLATAGTLVATFATSYAAGGLADKYIESYTKEKYGKDYSPSGLIGSGLSSADQAVSKLWTDSSKPAYTQTIGWKLADWLGL